LLGTTSVLLNVRFLVFTTRTGRAIEPRAVSRRFDLRRAKAGVRRIRAHYTRRTCGLLLAALDVHPGVAMQILRRSKISITIEIYTMVPDKQTLAALKRLSDALGSPDATLPDDAELTTCCCTPCCSWGQVFEKCVDLRGLEPLACNKDDWEAAASW
jgi:hypothetical protein